MSKSGDNSSTPNSLPVKHDALLHEKSNAIQGSSPRSGVAVEVTINNASAKATLSAPLLTIDCGDSAPLSAGQSRLPADANGAN